MKRLQYSSILLFTFLACKTGSQFEKQQANFLSAPKLDASSSNWPLVTIRPFEFENEKYSEEYYKKGFWLPGYLGIDIDAFGPWPVTTKEHGLTNKLSNIYDHPEFHKEFLEFVKTQRQNSNANKEIKVSIEGKFISAIIAIRHHTYGCWPLIGSIARIFNGESMTIVNSTKFHYKILNENGQIVEGEIVVATPKTIKFWQSLSYGFGIDIGTMQAEAMEMHLADIKRALYMQVLASVK